MQQPEQQQCEAHDWAMSLTHKQLFVLKRKYHIGRYVTDAEARQRLIARFCKCNFE